MEKVPKLAPDIPGFIVNRAFAALVAAAAIGAGTATRAFTHEDSYAAEREAR